MCAAIVVIYNVLLPWAERNKKKTWRRVIGDSAFRFLLSSFNARQLQRFLGSSVAQYTYWARQNKLPAVIDELGEDGQLMWLGPKRTDRVVLCCHGSHHPRPCSYHC
jgi:hypothetical protein